MPECSREGWLSLGWNRMAVINCFGDQGQLAEHGSSATMSIRDLVDQSSERISTFGLAIMGSMRIKSNLSSETRGESIEIENEGREVLSENARKPCSTK